MKTLTTLLAAVCIAIPAFAQSALKQARENAGNPEILRNWNVGETKHLPNATILRVDGENGIDHRTNVFYTANGGYIEEAPGGQITLFLDRNEKTLADLSLFTVSVKDSDGNELHRQCLRSENQPHYYKWDIWYQCVTVNLPVLVSKIFTIVVEDSGLNQRFEFLVTVKQDNELMPQQLLSSTTHLYY